MIRDLWSDREIHILIADDYLWAVKPNKYKQRFAKKITCVGKIVKKTAIMVCKIHQLNSQLMLSTDIENNVADKPISKHWSINY